MCFGAQAMRISVGGNKEPQGQSCAHRRAWKPPAPFFCPLMGPKGADASTSGAGVCYKISWRQSVLPRLQMGRFETMKVKAVRVVKSFECSLESENSNACGEGYF